MDLTSKKVVQNLLKKYLTRPSKRLGQHFLIDEEIIKKIIEAAELKPTDIVLEIGPGVGNLTIELAKKAQKIIAIEKDVKMVEILKETLKDYKNIEIIQNDILKDQIPKIHKIVANLPFYLTAPVIRKFLESAENKPRQMVLVVQKEVGQRICAKPPKANLLAVSVQFYANPEIISYIPKECFWPCPKVDSAIIKITPALLRLQRAGLCKLFFRIVKAGFSHPRKQLINNLSHGLNIDREEIKNWLLENNIQPIQRAETLTVENWILLTKNFHFVVKW